MSLFKYLACAGGLFVAAIIPAHAAVATTPPPVNAALIYHNYCSVCHGDQGDGRSRAQESLKPPPRDFTSTEARHELNRDRIVAAIAAGRPGTAMVGWHGQLNDAEIGALADYLLANFISPSGPAATAVRGKAIYAKNCSVCHGDKGDGGVWTTGLKYRPRNFTSPESRVLSREAMIDAVANGRAGTPMAAFGTQLRGNDIEEVVDYIRQEFMGAPREIAGLSGTSAHGTAAMAAVRTDMKAAMPNQLRGDAVQGGEFYMRNCLTCHGAAGDGQGPRAYFINPKPANFLTDSYRARLNRPALYQAIAKGKQGSEMPAWDKVLTPQQIANVTEFVFQTFIQSRPAVAAKKK